MYASILPSLLKRKSCEGKRGYDTRAQAKAGIKSLERAKGHKKDKFKAYKCEFCGKYHFGHQAKLIQY